MLKPSPMGYSYSFGESEVVLDTTKSRFPSPIKLWFETDQGSVRLASNYTVTPVARDRWRISSDPAVEGIGPAIFVKLRSFDVKKGVTFAIE
ncbi:MAG: hypothetical protein V4689_12720 [Verrucomicrobiota bacterium]